MRSTRATMTSGLSERISSPVRATASDRPRASLPARPRSAAREPRSGPGWECAMRPAARPLPGKRMTDGEGTMPARHGLSVVLAALLAACGGGGGSGSSGGSNPTPPPYSSVTLVQLSKPPTFAPGCDGVAANGTLYTGTTAEPSFVVNPANTMNLIAGWQQNRWSNGGAQGLNLAASFDGGTTWTLSNAAFSRCTGGASGTPGDYARASDVWLTASPNGVVYALSLSFTGISLSPGSSSAQVVA